VLKVPVLRLDPDLPLPVVARPGDAGMDLLARVDVDLAPSGGRALVPTGIALALPDGWCALVVPRSGLAVKHGLTVLNAPGLIDAGYRGEIMVPMVNLDPSAPYHLARGDRIAQLMVQPVTVVGWDEVSELPPSDRGEGGFGHSGR
jgi:dUTP pyrophosphatase